ncbi:MAG: sulfite exporter TauE/SafE family protein [Xanthobacteraceae bacterium]|nr:sulfite exporter TauE/SafE family protein [Xanthobacteraceae bacterium]
MLAQVIETATPGVIMLLAACLVIAGLVKGVIGVGMPTVAFPLLSMLVDVQTAVMLLSMPLVLSNIPQALEGGSVGQTLRSLAPVLVGMIPGVWIGVAVLLNVDPAVAKIVAGASVILVAALTLLAPKLRVNQRLTGPAGLGAGFCGGLLGGIAALSGPLVFIFLLAKGLSVRAFTKEASMFLVVSSVVLTSALTSSQKFDWRDVVISTVATAPVVVGMLAGQKVRDAIPADAFRRLVVLTVLLSGAQLVWKGVFA